MKICLAARTHRVAALSLMTLVGSSNVMANQWICAGSNDWSNTGCWSTGAVPVAGEVVDLTQSSGLNRQINYDNSINSGATFGELTINGTGLGVVALSQTLNYSLNASNLIVGRTGRGSISQTAGSNIYGTASVGSLVGGNGNYDIGGLASVQVNGDFNIGVFGTGAVNQTAGSVSVGSNLYLGAEYRVSSSAGGIGSYSLTGGSLSVTGDEYIGQWGTGSFFQDGGTTNTVGGEVYVGRKAGPLGAPQSGSYTLNSGSLTAGGLQVGLIPEIHDGTVDDVFPYTHEASNGHFVQNGGTVNAAHVWVSVSGGANGHYELNDGTLNSPSIENNDTFDYRGGAINGNVINRDRLNLSGPGTRIITGSLQNVGTTNFSQRDYAETVHGMITMADGTLLSVTQNLDLDSNGTVAIDFGNQFYNTQSGTGAWITVGNVALVDGILDLSNFSGFTPVNGDSWDVLDAMELNNTFSSVIFPVIPNWNWLITYDYDLDKIILSGNTTAVPIPAAAWLFASGLLGLVGVARRRS